MKAETKKKAVKAKKADVKAIVTKAQKAVKEVAVPEVFVQELKIPRDRVGVLVGKKGEVKKYIEHKAGVRLEISSDGDVIIKGHDNVMIYDVKTIVQAIGRGFSPDVAMQLFNEQNVFELLDVTDYAGKSKKRLDRLRGRVIGESGRSRMAIEDLTETNISVYGKTIGIIGEMEMVALARQAIDMLLSGAPHGVTYRMVENKRREMHRRRIESMYATD